MLLFWILICFSFTFFHHQIYQGFCIEVSSLLKFQASNLLKFVSLAILKNNANISLCQDLPYVVTKDLLVKQTLPFTTESLKLISYGILHYLWSAGLSKSFSRMSMLIFKFSEYFLIDFSWWKNVGLPLIAYIMIQ